MGEGRKTMTDTGDLPTGDEIVWTRTGNKTHRVEFVPMAKDGYPVSYNRWYEHGRLIRAWPGSDNFRGNGFYDCSVIDLTGAGRHE